MTTKPKSLHKDYLEPPLPKANERGNYPALETMRVLLARDIIRDRQRLGLTQAELATLAGIRVETICRLETGKHTPTIATMNKIDEALKRADTTAGAKNMANVKLTTGQVAKLLRISKRRVSELVEKRQLVPVAKPRDGGSSMLFAAMDVLGVGAELGLRAAGFSSAVAAAIRTELKKYSDNRLRECFARGETHMMFLPEKAAVHPDLLPEEAIVRNPALNELAKASGIKPRGLNVQEMYQKLRAKVAEMHE